MDRRSNSARLFLCSLGEGGSIKISCLELSLCDVFLEGKVVCTICSPQFSYLRTCIFLYPSNCFRREVRLLAVVFIRWQKTRIYQVISGSLSKKSTDTIKSLGLQGGISFFLCICCIFLKNVFVKAAWNRIL